MRDRMVVYMLMQIFKAGTRVNKPYTAENLAAALANISGRDNAKDMVDQVEAALQFGVAYGVLCKQNEEYFLKSQRDGQASEMEGHPAEMTEAAGMGDMSGVDSISRMIDMANMEEALADLGEDDFEDDDEACEETEDDLMRELRSLLREYARRRRTRKGRGRKRRGGRARRRRRR